MTTPTDLVNEAQVNFVVGSDQFQNNVQNVLDHNPVEIAENVADAGQVGGILPLGQRPPIRFHLRRRPRFRLGIIVPLIFREPVRFQIRRRPRSVYQRNLNVFESPPPFPRPPPPPPPPPPPWIWLLSSSDGIADAEVERRLRDAKYSSAAVPSTIPSLDSRLVSALQYAVARPSIPAVQPNILGPVVSFPNKQMQQLTSVLKPVTQVGLTETSLRTSPAREEGEVQEYELDPDMRTRLLIMKQGQDMRDQVASEPQFPVIHPMQASVPRFQGRGGWFPVEEEMGPQQAIRVVPPKEFPLHSETMHIEKQHPHHLPFIHKVENPIISDRVLGESQRLPKEALQRDKRLRSSHPLSSYPSFLAEEISFGKPSGADLDSYSETPVVILQDIAFKCGVKVEFKATVISSTDLQFRIEVFFAGEKVGEGVGRTRREAQFQAAEGSLMSLAEKYMSRNKADASSGYGDGNRFSNANGNGFLDANTFGHHPLPKDGSLTFPDASEPSRVLDPRMEGSRRTMGSISALKELCMVEGLDMTFQLQPQVSGSTSEKNEVYAQVEIDGQILGKGTGLTWEKAKAQAAEKALGGLKSMLGQHPHKRQVSPRPFQANK